jgi:hypothetical protein
MPWQFGSPDPICRWPQSITDRRNSSTVMKPHGTFVLVSIAPRAQANSHEIQRTKDI